MNDLFLNAIRLNTGLPIITRHVAVQTTLPYVRTYIAKGDNVPLFFAFLPSSKIDALLLGESILDKRLNNALQDYVQQNNAHQAILYYQAMFKDKLIVIAVVEDRHEQVIQFFEADKLLTPIQLSNEVLEGLTFGQKWSFFPSKKESHH